MGYLHLLEMFKQKNWITLRNTFNGEKRLNQLLSHKIQINLN